MSIISYKYYTLLSKYANIFNIYLKYKKEKEKHNLLKSTFQSQCQLFSYIIYKWMSCAYIKNKTNLNLSLIRCIL